MGNKTDLEDKRKVSIEEGRSLALKENYKFMECSCLKNENVKEAFYELIMWSILDKKEKNDIDNDLKINGFNKMADQRLSFTDIKVSFDSKSSNYLEEKKIKEKYPNLEEIGEGAYGKIYKSKINANEYRAIKEIDIEKYKKQLEDNFSTNIEEDLNKLKNYISNEIKSMIICSQENKNMNSVNFYEYFYNEKKIFIVMELCDDNLNNILKKKEGGFSIEEIREIILQLNKTFKIMNENNIIHRDLKLENILVKYINKEKTKYIVKLADYGISRNINNLTTNKLTNIGTTCIMAPEILKNEKYNDKCDLWSLGVIIYLLFFKNYPVHGQTEMALLNNIKLFEKKPLNTNNELLDDLLSKLLKSDPKKRITWEQYFNHPFFKTIEELKNNKNNKNNCLIM